MATPVRHPALKAQDDMYALAEENKMLKAQGQQAAMERDQMGAQMQQMMQPAPQAAPVDVGPRISPIDALYDGVSQGATLTDLAEAGMLEPAIAEMQSQGLSEDDQARMLQELDMLSQQPNTSQGGAGNPYTMQ